MGYPDLVLCIFIHLIEMNFTFSYVRGNNAIMQIFKHQHSPVKLILRSSFGFLQIKMRNSKAKNC